MNLEDWKSKHQTVDLLGQKLSYVDTQTSGKVLFIIHGYGTSSYDYHKIIGDLQETNRVIAPDLIGFGLSSKPKGYYFSIIDQAQILAQFIRLLDIKEATFISQGIGSSVFCELVSLIKSNTIDLKIRNIVLLNLSLSLEISSKKENQDFLEKFIASIFLKFTISFEMFKKYLKKSFYNDELISEDELKVYWDLMNLNDGRKTLKFIDYAIVECENFSDRWLKALNNYAATLHLIWGMEDPSGNLETPYKIRESIEFDENNLFYLEKCGYFTMLEKPKEFIEIIQKIES